MRYFIPPVNMRNFSARTGLGFVHAGPARSYAAIRHRRARMNGLGIAPQSSAIQFNTGAPRICPAWGCGPAPIRVIGPGPGGNGYSDTPVLPTNPIVNSSVSTSGGSSAQQVANTPVPVGFNLNSVFIAPNGSQWEYSTTAGTWINVGTPYNLNQTTGATTTTPTTAAGIASTAAQVAGTPVPQGYPTNAAYVDNFGNTWQFNGNVWAVTSTAAQSAAALATGATAASSIPVGTPTSAPYTDANGNVWTYDASTGQWVMTTAAASSPYTSVLDWLSEATLLSPVPNWALVAGIGFVALKFMQPSTGRR